MIRSNKRCSPWLSSGPEFASLTRFRISCSRSGSWTRRFWARLIFPISIAHFERSFSSSTSFLSISSILRRQSSMVIYLASGPPAKLLLVPPSLRLRPFGLALRAASLMAFGRYPHAPISGSHLSKPARERANLADDVLIGDVFLYCFHDGTPHNGSIRFLPYRANMFRPRNSETNGYRRFRVRAQLPQKIFKIR